MTEQTIVHVVSTLQSSGPQRIVLDLSSTPELSGYKHKVVCVFARRGELIEAYRSAGIEAVACPFPVSDELRLPSYRLARWIGRKLEPSFPYRFALILGKLKADLVHTHVTSRIDLQTAGAVIKAGVPMVWTIHGLQTKSPENLARRKRAAQIMAKGRGRIAAVSQAVADDMANSIGLDQDAIEVIFGGIDLSRFKDKPDGSSPLRASLNIPPEATIFGAVGLLQHEKGHDVFIDAAKLVREASNNGFFVVAGPGKLLPALQARIEQCGLGDRFFLLGYRNDVPALLKQFDVFVLPSRKEGLPLALLEALASGLPCIASSVGGIPEILKAGGILIQPESPQALANAMKQMLDAGERVNHARRAEAIAANFSINASAAQYARLYSRLLDSPAATPDYAS